jgi:poly-gamma-glutamate synthesis protein (capsule biosynthesis protein)
MLVRGIDRAVDYLPSPELREPGADDARGYLRMAEARPGSISQPLTSYDLWGPLMRARNEDPAVVVIVNLETSVTVRGSFAPGKHVRDRMHPDNLLLLTEFGVDAVSLANNNGMDFGLEGLSDTLDSVRAAVPAAVGAGSLWVEAAAPN